MKDMVLLQRQVHQGQPHLGLRPPLVGTTPQATDQYRHDLSDTSKTNGLGPGALDQQAVVWGSAAP